MSGKYLLDTNIVIALFAGDLPVKKHIATVNDRHNGATDFRRNGASEKG